MTFDRDDAGRLREDYWTNEWGTVAEDFHEITALGARSCRQQPGEFGNWRGEVGDTEDSPCDVGTRSRTMIERGSKTSCPACPGQHGKVAKDNRQFVDAVLWIARPGAPWRDLPERFGNGSSAWRRFDRSSRKGVWRRVFDALQDPDLAGLILNSTIIRAHPRPSLRRRFKKKETPRPTPPPI